MVSLIIVGGNGFNCTDTTQHLRIGAIGVLNHVFDRNEIPVDGGSGANTPFAFSKVT